MQSCLVYHLMSPTYRHDCSAWSAHHSLSVLSLTHHLATISSNLHLKITPPLVHKGVFLNEVGRPQKLNLHQK